MAPLSKEEENYVRLALLLKGVSPRAVRTFFDKEIPPIDLPSTLKKSYTILSDLKLKRHINQSQWNLLIPRNGVPDSKTFDVTLMICLIRNLTSINPPINGFDTLPPPVETTPGSDLARIKFYRNKLAHHDKDTLDTLDYNTAWKDVSDAVLRLGGHPMYQECQELKVKILDQSNKEIIFGIRQHLQEIKEVRQIEENLEKEQSKMAEQLSDVHSIVGDVKVLQDFQKKVKEDLENPIPWNIRVQIEEELQKWKRDDKKYIETKAANSVLKCIKENDCVVVTGSFGCGKSSLIRHVALQMQANGFNVVPVFTPDDLIRWNNPKNKNLFVVDHFCGRFSLNFTKYKNWKQGMQTIKTLLENKQLKLIVSCRLQVYKDVNMSMPFFSYCECNLLSEDMCFSKREKQSISDLYMITKASKVKENFDIFDCFPRLCQLYSKNIYQNVVNFFMIPFKVYKEEIDRLQTDENHGKYCALALCVMFNNCLKEEWLMEDVDKDMKKNH